MKYCVRSNEVWSQDTPTLCSRVHLLHVSLSTSCLALCNGKSFLVFYWHANSLVDEGQIWTFGFELFGPPGNRLNTLALYSLLEICVPLLRCLNRSDLLGVHSPDGLNNWEWQYNLQLKIWGKSFRMRYSFCMWFRSQLFKPSGKCTSIYRQIVLELFL